MAILRPALIRASYLREEIAAIDVLGQDVADRVRASIPRATFDRIMAASRIEWLPIELDIEISKAVADVAGIDALIETSKQSFLRSASGPLLQPILAVAVRLFGLTPAAFAMFIPIAWRAAIKDGGQVSLVRRSANELDVTIGPVPPIMCDDAWANGLIGTLRGILAVSKRDGVAARVEAPAGELRYALSWGPMVKDGARGQ